MFLLRVTDTILETHTSPAGGPILLHIMKILEGYNFTIEDLKEKPSLTYHRIVEVRCISA